MNNEIIGHDIDGLPLRVGDEVVLLSSAHKEDPDVGKRCAVVGPAEDDGIYIKTGTIGGNGTDIWYCYSRQVRKLHNDHRPANESFTEMMDKFKGVRV